MNANEKKDKFTAAIKWWVGDGCEVWGVYIFFQYAGMNRNVLYLDSLVFGGHGMILGNVTPLLHKMSWPSNC